MKVVISSGCSFTDTAWANTWPVHLVKYYPTAQHIKSGLSASGNGLISRKIIYEVTEALKTHKPKDILVGVMWSGRDRHDVYLSDPPKFEHNSGWRSNPTRFIKSSSNHWTLLNWYWENDFAKQYFTQYHDNIGSQIYTIEHVLRIQWFLQLHQIPYFMSTFTDEVFDKGMINHIDVDHLYEQIDFTHFLPVKGEHEWARDHSGLPFAQHDAMHPTEDQHKMFVDEVIVPYLKTKNYL